MPALQFERDMPFKPEDSLLIDIDFKKDKPARVETPIQGQPPVTVPGELAPVLEPQEKEDLQQLIDMIRSKNPYQLDQTGALQLPGFDNEDAWTLGVALVEEARRRRAAVVVDISRAGHQLFHAALAGTAPDNDAWVARKGRVVTRFGHSSLYMGQLCRDRGSTLQEVYGLPVEQYAAHGGAFPVIVRGVGPVGVVAVSGLPQLQDHRLVVDVLRLHLGARA